MSRQNGGWILTLVAGLLFAWPATAETRLALVIGNSAYKHTSRLPNPASDAELMAAVLGKVGFRVTKLLNASRDDMMRGLLDFSRSLREPGVVALFYYAGHGLQVNGLNYLVPVNADIRREDEVKIQTVDLSDLLQTMNAHGGREGRLNLVILDACRNNPFARGWRSAGQGLAPIDSPSGTLISFATAPGDVAFDGKDGNSPFTKGLAKSILIPGIPIEQTFKKTRSYVQEATAGEGKPQVPWETTSLTGDFYFIPSAIAAVPGSPETSGPEASEAETAPQAQRPAEIAALPRPSDAPSTKCTVVGARIERPINVRVGTELCSSNGEGRATIEDITSYSVIYTGKAGRVTCRGREICSLGWEGAPLFNIRIVATPGGGERSADLVPNAF